MTKTTISEMADLLAKSLRDHAVLTNITGGFPADRATMTSRAADRIEALEAALNEILREAPSLQFAQDVARRALKGERE